MKKFTQKDAEKIAPIIGSKKISVLPDKFRMKISNEEDKRELVLEIFPETSFGKTRGMLVVVYTGNSHLQLHNCTGYVVSEELAEVTFVADRGDNLSGIVVERGASCSLYASLDRELISSDFTQLGVEVMLSGVALSLTEEILSSNKKNDEN